MKMIYGLIIVLLTSMIIPQDTNGEHIPSTERGDPNYRRATNEDVNKVRTSIFNYGITGRTGANPGEIPYEWPVNSGKHYIAMTDMTQASINDLWYDKYGQFTIKIISVHHSDEVIKFSVTMN